MPGNELPIQKTVKLNKTENETKLPV